MNEYEVTIKSTMDVKRTYLVVGLCRESAESVGLRRYVSGDGEYTEEVLSESIREISTKKTGEIE